MEKILSYSSFRVDKLHESKINTFIEVKYLIENVQAAKDYLLKQYAEKKKVKPSEISDEEKRDILLDPKFIEIRDLVAKQPGYTLPFLIFHLDQKATIEELQEILDYLNKFKNQLSELSMPVADFAKIQPTKDDHRPGYEHLGDELRNIERRRKLKELYNELTPRMKKQFNKASNEEIEDLTAISNKLKSLPDIVSNDDLDAEGKPRVRNAWKDFSRNMKKYDDIRTYPEYADEKVAFSDILKDALDFIENWGQDEDTLLKKLKELGPQVGILYSKKGYIVMSARTPEAQRAVCSDTKWCIRNDSTFWSDRYTSRRIQINIVNSNLPVTNDLSLIGMTINPNGTIHDDATRPNNRLRDQNGRTFRTYTDALRGLGYPEELIKNVEDKFQMEVDIKLAMEHYYRDGSNLSPRGVIESLITMSKGFLSGVMPQEDWERISGTVAQLIFKDKGLTKGAFMSIFTKHGIFIEAGWNVFDALIGDDYTKEEMKKIGESTESALEAMENLLQLSKYESLGIRKSDVDAMKEVVSNKKWVLEQISKRM